MIDPAEGAGADSETVKTKLVVPAFPSASVTSLIDAVTPLSSLVIVPVAWVSPPRVAFVALFRLTVKLSSGSGTVSPTMTIWMLPLAWPAGMTRFWPTCAT